MTYFHQQWVDGDPTEGTSFYRCPSCRSLSVSAVCVDSGRLRLRCGDCRRVDVEPTEVEKPPVPGDLLGAPSWGHSDIWTVKVYETIATSHGLPVNRFGIYCICLSQDEALRVELRLRAHGHTVALKTETLMFVQPSGSDRSDRVAPVSPPGPARSPV